MEMIPDMLPTFELYFLQFLTWNSKILISHFIHSTWSWKALNTFTHSESINNSSTHHHISNEKFIQKSRNNTKSMTFFTPTPNEISQIDKHLRQINTASIPIHVVSRLSADMRREYMTLTCVWWLCVCSISDETLLSTFCLSLFACCECLSFGVKKFLCVAWTCSHSNESIDFMWKWIKW